MHETIRDSIMFGKRSQPSETPGEVLLLQRAASVNAVAGAPIAIAGKVSPTEGSECTHPCCCSHGSPERRIRRP